MFARAAVLIVLLPAIAVSDVPPPLAPGWLPETAVIDIPGEAPITVTFLAELQKPDPVYADYESALEAARAGDGEAAYLLFKQAMRCDLMRLRKQRAAPSPRQAGDMQLDFDDFERQVAFCATMPNDARRLRHHWLRDAAAAGYPPAILLVGMGMGQPRDESRARLEQLWYRGNLLALGELADGERQWTRLSPESTRTLLVRSMGYEWLYVKVSQAAYGGAAEHQRLLAQLTRNFEHRWSALDEKEQRVALLHAHSLLLESKQCCTIPASGPLLVF